MTETLKIGMSATEWAREHGEKLRAWCHTDNYEPPRETVALDVYRFTGHSGRTEYLLDSAMDILRGADAAGYLLDDGRTVTPLYVAGWHPDRRYVLAHTFPANFDADGNPLVRADDRRPVNFDTWALGPRRYYHLKVRTTT